MVEIRARIISGLKYKPLLWSKLEKYSDLSSAIDKRGAFILKIKEGVELALSWWVSPKRTRSYPYARVYDTLASQLKRVTIIPIMKDEGLDGDRDFIQWDTISLMSLLNVYVILGYYSNAKKNPIFSNKITDQKFNIKHINQELFELLNYKSDALHWNLNQIDKIKELAQIAIDSYLNLSKKIGVKIHSPESIMHRINRILHKKNLFMKDSRIKAKRAQYREAITQQPKEKTAGKKGIITIQNYLGGIYYFTCDEVQVSKNKLYLIEAKHTQQKLIPSLNDIKDGLLKIALYVNLEEVELDGNEFVAQPVLKLTSGTEMPINKISIKEKYVLRKLIKEAEDNGFLICYNNTIINDLRL